MIRKTAAFAAVAVVSAGLLALTACAPGDPNAGPAADPEALPATGWNRVDPDQLEQGGTLNLARPELGHRRRQLEQQHRRRRGGLRGQHGGADLRDRRSPSTRTDRGRSTPTTPTSIELTSDDPQTVTVKLNDKAVWEDGSPMTAADYKATFHALSGTDPAYNIASSAGFDQVTSFDIASDYEFSFTLDPVFADWPNLMNAMILPEGDRGRPGGLEHRLRRQAARRRAVRSSTRASTTRPTPSRATPNPVWWGPSRSWTRSPSR